MLFPIYIAREVNSNNNKNNEPTLGFDFSKTY